MSPADARDKACWRLSEYVMREAHSPSVGDRKSSASGESTSPASASRSDRGCLCPDCSRRTSPARSSDRAADPRLSITARCGRSEMARQSICTLRKSAPRTAHSSCATSHSAARARHGCYKTAAYRNVPAYAHAAPRSQHAPRRRKRSFPRATYHAAGLADGGAASATAIPLMNANLNGSSALSPARN